MLTSRHRRNQAFQHGVQAICPHTVARGRNFNVVSKHITHLISLSVSDSVSDSSLPLSAMKCPAPTGSRRLMVRPNRKMLSSSSSSKISMMFCLFIGCVLKLTKTSAISNSGSGEAGELLGGDVGSTAPRKYSGVVGIYSGDDVEEIVCSSYSSYSSRWFASSPEDIA